MPKLVKKVIEPYEPKARDYIVFDSEIPGFGVRVFKTGRKSFVLQYRYGRRLRRMTIGACHALSPAEARTKARIMLASVEMGNDPQAKIEESRHGLTVADLAERFRRDHIEIKLKPGTQREYEHSLKKYILPTFGTMLVNEVKRHDVATLHHRMYKTPAQANRTLRVISLMFNLAEMWGIREEGINPCKYVKRYPEKPKERFLSSQEISRLGQVLDELDKEGIEEKSSLYAIRLLLLTGCRLSEILTLKWEYINFVGKSLHLPDSKTGPKVVHVASAVINVLQQMQECIERPKGNPYVIYGKIPGSHLINLQKPWRRIRKQTGLEDVRIHDLRHTFASNAVSLGQSLPMIGKMLGHKQVQTTARYAHLAVEPLKNATEDVVKNLEELLKEKNK